LFIVVAFLGESWWAALVLIPAIDFGRRMEPWLWRMIRLVRHFKTVSNKRLVLHYEPGIDERVVPMVVNYCLAELDRLTEWFGFRLKGRPTIYLFDQPKPIAKLVDDSSAKGYCLYRANAIFIALDFTPHESIPHELTHLYSARLSRRAPLMLREGLSVWMQLTWFEQLIDSAARPFLATTNLKLESFLKSEFFTSNSDNCYLLSGSFTGFLIHRYGREKYQQMYRSCNESDFEAMFKKCFELSLQEAEQQWRAQVIGSSLAAR
jgi:hypothetical protein